jgi:predicted nucleotidyltransferase
MDMTINQDIIAITNKIKETVPAERIYLFGSYAYGSPNKDSDYDIFVIIPDNSMRPMEAMQKIYRSLSKTRMSVSVDVLASYESKFNERKEFSTLENKIAREGVILYERNGLDIQLV